MSESTAGGFECPGIVCMCWCCPFVAGISCMQDVGHAEGPASESRTIDCKLGHAHPFSRPSSFGNPHSVHKGFRLSPSLSPSNHYSGTRPRAEPLIHTREPAASSTMGYHWSPLWQFRTLATGTQLSFPSPAPSPPPHSSQKYLAKDHAQNF